MHIDDRIPKSSLLKEFIISYYFSKSEENKLTRFTYYPHYVETINVFNNASVSIKDEIFELNFKKAETVIILNVGKSVFRESIVKNKYDLSGIHFKPLFSRKFFDFNCFQYIANGVYRYISNHPIEEICKIQNVVERSNALEEYFLLNYKASPKDDIELMVDRIHQSKAKITIKELEDNFKLNRRTILRRFQKYLLCSFEEYKNIVRFRNVMDNYNSVKFDAQAYLNDDMYYDQSDFINHFKNFTGESPGKLLQLIKANPDSIKYFWKLANQ